MTLAQIVTTADTSPASSYPSNAIRTCAECNVAECVSDGASPERNVSDPARNGLLWVQDTGAALYAATAFKKCHQYGSTIDKNSSGDKIANANFLRRYRTYT